MQGFKKPAHHRRVTGVLTLVLAKFTCCIVKVPEFGNLYRKQFDNYIQRFHSRKIVGEVCSYAERGLTERRGKTVNLDSGIRIEPVAEHHLLAAGINAKRTIFSHNLHQFLAIVAAVDPQSAKHIGKIL